MSTAKEKAEELVDKYLISVEVSFKEDSIPRIVNAPMRIKSAKQCALIAVDEIIYYLEIVLGVDKEDFEYWQEVKTEIEKL